LVLAVEPGSESGQCRVLVIRLRLILPDLRLLVHADHPQIRPPLISTGRRIELAPSWACRRVEISIQALVTLENAPLRWSSLRRPEPVEGSRPLAGRSPTLRRCWVCWLGGWRRAARCGSGRRVSGLGPRGGLAPCVFPTRRCRSCC